MEAVSGIIGGAVGGALVAFVSWLFRRADVTLAREEEHKQAYRNVLSYLLDLHGVMRLFKSDVASKVDAILNELVKRLAENMDAAEAEQVYAELKPVVFNKMLIGVAGPFLDSIPEFKSAVSRLAPIDPIAAFHIRASRSIMQVVEDLEQIVANGTGEATPLSPIFHNMMDTGVKSRMFNTVLESLTEMIEEVGAHVEPKHLANAREFMNREFDEGAELDEGELTLVGQLHQGIIETITASNPDGQFEEVASPNEG